MKPEHLGKRGGQDITSWNVLWELYVLNLVFLVLSNSSLCQIVAVFVCSESEFRPICTDMIAVQPVLDLKSALFELKVVSVVAPSVIILCTELLVLSLLCTMSMLGFTHGLVQLLCIHLQQRKTMRFYIWQNLTALSNSPGSPAIFLSPAFNINWGFCKTGGQIRRPGDRTWKGEELTTVESWFLSSGLYSQQWVLTVAQLLWSIQ